MMTFKAYCEAYFATNRHAYSPKTLKAYTSQARVACLFFGDKPMDNVTPTDICAFIQSGDVSGDTRANRLAFAKTIFAHAHDRNVVNINPALSIKPPRRVEGRERYLTKDECRALMLECSKVSNRKHIRAHVKAMIALGLFAGLRLNEALKLRWEDVDFENGIIHVQSDTENGRTTKSCRNRHIPVNAQLLEILTAHRDITEKRKQLCEWVFPSTGENEGEPRAELSNYVDKVMKKVGPDVSFHVLRHTYTTLMCTDQGVDARTLQRLLGHANIETTMRYMHPTKESMNLSRGLSL